MNYLSIIRLLPVGMFLWHCSAATADSCLAEPVKLNPNMVTSTFGKSRALPQYNGVAHNHWGVDFQARDPANPSTGADLLSVDNGTVIGAGFWGSGYGNRVALKRDNGDIVIYSHLAKVEPKLKSGAAAGFKETDGGPGLGNMRVSAGDKVGVAGGTADHMNTNQRAIHLHLEYVTNYAGNKLRETNDGTDTTRSRYMRNVLSYMCKSVKQAPGAGPTTEPSGGTAPVPAGGSATSNDKVPSSDDQIYEASKTQPDVSDRERYGTPDAPPYDTYAGMSESQVIEAEMLRRTLDTEWEEKLTSWGRRGLLMEIARMRGVKLWMKARLAAKNQRVEAMMASMLAYRTNTYFNAPMKVAYSKAQAQNSVNKVK